MALLEFTIEPFVDGRPGPHVTAAIDAAAARGIAVDVGPFGTSCAVPDHEAGEVAAAIIDSALANGATHVTIDVSLNRHRHRHRHRRRSGDRGGPPVSGLPRHPVVLAVRPIVEALGATLVPADDQQPGDLPLRWDNTVLAAVRPAPLHGALDRLIDQVERELGGSLAKLGREDKQHAVRLLDQRGAFTLRRAVEVVADAMGVSRITVYNYLNALHRTPAR